MCQRFYYGRRSNKAMLPLRNEFTRLSAVHLTTIDQIMINKMNGGDMILFSLNCQSLRACARDPRRNIVQKAHIFMLSETKLRNEELVEIENFKRSIDGPSINRGGEVAIYQNVCDSQHKFIGNRDDFVRRNTQYVNQTKSNVGDIRSARDSLYLTVNPLLRNSLYFCQSERY
ncbi:hypothetical protein TNIN_118681 [Trichonephila inaurata madagascariensis]|uniref:Uncharacterized protein n=1 Tax=Trichonephila inaurata madagascariensis TaxID=2747483 RepID=A0A8X6YAF6_9ARAC|nr:hypothetical protein TNIN_118681 [Trichonephila inaurata madagascariensis]